MSAGMSVGRCECMISHVVVGMSMGMMLLCVRVWV